MPLDEVPGLYLDAYYECFEDEGWRFSMQIRDDKVTSSETEAVWKDCTPESAGVDIGRPLVERAEAAWKQLGDVCVDDDGNIGASVYVYALGKRYERGTDREEIWHDIEDGLHVSVAWLMGEAKNPDGTN